jgi:futalosine hydrolase
MATQPIATMPRHLVLIPTELERRIIAPHFAGATPELCRIELCGFGMVAAAARAAAAIAQARPDRVLLVGVAGAYDDRLPLGTAWGFRRVGCSGIGAGSGDAFVSAEAMGWPQWPGEPAHAETAIGDEIACAAAAWPQAPWADLLLSVTAASGDAADAARRRRSFPAAAAEDMEGFGVALACRLAQVPLTIVRGISNVAGDRNTAAWKLADAADAAGGLAARLVEEAA